MGAAPQNQRRVCRVPGKREAITKRSCDRALLEVHSQLITEKPDFAGTSNQIPTHSAQSREDCVKYNSRSLHESDLEHYTFDLVFLLFVDDAEFLSGAFLRQSCRILITN